MREQAPYGQPLRDPYATQPAPLWPTPPHPRTIAPGSTAPLPAHLAPQPAAPASEMARPQRVRRRSVLGDVTAGLILGDFASDLGLPGAVTQVAISFVPLIGSTCAMRDLIADLRHHDHVGAALNALALTPVLGGFSKTFEVIRSTAHVGHAVHVSHQQAQRRNGDEENNAQPAPSTERKRHR